MFYVGRGSYPNSEGTLQLDAAMMRGRDCSFGAVAGLERSATVFCILVIYCSNSFQFTWEHLSNGRKRASSDHTGASDSLFLFLLSLK